MGRLALAVVVTAAAGAALADPLVVRANGPSAARFRPGATLPETGQVTLRAQDSLTLLNNGRTWVLTGPGTFPLNAPVARRATGRVMASVNDRRVRVGAVRTVDGLSLDRPNLWMIDVAQPGAACVVDMTALMLWRAEANEAATGVLTAPDGTAVTLTWAPDQASQDWPSAVTAIPGATYQLTTGSAAPVSLTLTPLNREPTSEDEAAQALIESGCEAQLNLLLAQIEELTAETEE